MDGELSVDGHTIPITALVLTKNEERVIARTCDKLQLFDQILVVDSKSVDKTREIAESKGATVVDFEWDGQYPKKKQWSLELSCIRNDWVLFVDADEYPDDVLLGQLLRNARRLATTTFAAFDLRLRYSFLDRELRHGHRVTKRALVHRSRCRFPVVADLDVANMWEVEGHYQPVSSGKIGQMPGALIHEDPDPLFDYFARHNRYSDWEAHLQAKDTVQRAVDNVRSRRGKRYARVPLKPIVFFLYSYVLRLGFLDGGPGFHYALAHSFYFWQISVKVRQLRDWEF